MMAEALHHLLPGGVLVHGMDAARRREWRILRLLRDLPGRLGAGLFVGSRVPLVALLLASGAGAGGGPARIGLAAFAVLHAWLHWRLRHHPRNPLDARHPGRWSC
jgi:hypothetical protein